MKKETFVTKDQLDEIIKTYPTPFYLYDERGIRRNMKALKDAFSWNEGYKEYFAVKATPNPFLININMSNIIQIDDRAQFICVDKLFRRCVIRGEHNILSGHINRFRQH